MASKTGRGADFDDRLATLIAACAQGDHQAFRTLYDLQAPRLYGIALRITGQPALAADAVHDVLLQVWRRAERFDGSRGSPGAWLTSLARYRAIDLVRKCRRETLGADPADEVDDAPGPLDRLLTVADGTALHHCLGTLDPAPRRAIMLAYVQGLSHSELAERMGAPLGTVKSWVRRGLAALRACLPS